MASETTVEVEAIKTDPEHPISDRSLSFRCGMMGLLLLANILNYADRTILSVLAESLKEEFGVTDAQLGFLHGTSFAILAAILGMAAAKLADNWMRNRLMALGVGVWSLMTFVSGLATSFWQLTIARIGVGSGESVMSPIGHAMPSDMFSADRRGAVLGIYLIGPTFGTAVCLAVGGWILTNWENVCGGIGACSLKPWQAAFFTFGLPGLLVAAAALIMGEIATGKELERRRATKPVAMGLGELRTLLPPLTFQWLYARGGMKAVKWNLVSAAIIVAVASALIHFMGDPLQWILVGIGAYALASWSQALAYEDQNLFQLTMRSPAFFCLIFGVALLSCVSAALMLWSVPLAMRTFQVSAAEAGGALSLTIAIGSVGGLVLGGLLSDFLRRFTRAAVIWVAIGGIVVSAGLLYALLHAPSLGAFSILTGLMLGVVNSWNGGAAALVQDLILPTMRARAASVYALFILLIAMCLGPYLVGRISDWTGSIGVGLATLYYAAPASIAILIWGARALPAAYAKRDALVAAGVR